MDLNEPILPARDETPTKYISYDEKVTIRCMLQYIDFEGLTDGRSIKNILARIAPRKLVCCDKVQCNAMQKPDLLYSCHLLDYRSWHPASNRTAFSCIVQFGAL
jgi:cleavage and polyadenylation specificity factor subunit 2